MIHCAAGVGRTGVMLGAYLMKKFNLTPEEAIKRVREARPGSIEVHQEKAISDYSKSKS